jgi:hypothetical protein
MSELLCSVLAILAAPFKSRRRLEAENVILRHQLIILRRKVPCRARLTNGDRWFLVYPHRLFPSILQALRLSIPRRWCVGIGRAFATIGVGSPVLGEGGPGSTLTFVR